MNEFINYYEGKCASDMRLFFQIFPAEGDEPNGVLTCRPMDNPSRSKVVFDDGKKEKEMFTAIVFLTTLFAQGIGVTCGCKAMMAFHRASGWPWINCGMGGTMSPTVVIMDAELTVRWDTPELKQLFDGIRSNLLDQFISFIKGGELNLHRESYSYLVESAHGKEEELIAFMQKYTDEYLAYCQAGFTGPYTDMLLQQEDWRR